MNPLRQLAILLLLHGSCLATITRTIRLTETSKTSASSWTTTGTVTAATGDTLVVGVAFHDASQAGTTCTWNTGTAQTLTVLDGAGVNNAKAILCAKNNVTGGTATLTIAFNIADSAHALFATTLTGSNGTLTTGSAAHNTGTTTSVTTTPDITCTPNSGGQCGWIGVIGDQGPSGDAAPTWTNPNNGGQRAGTTGGAAGSNNTVVEGWEIDSSGITQSLSATLGTARSWAAILAAWTEPASGGTAMKDPIPLRGVIPFPR